MRATSCRGAGMYDGTLGVIGAIEALAVLKKAVRAPLS